MSCAEFSGKHQITQATQPPYSPYLALCDFWLFPKLKLPLKRKRFQTVDEIQENVTGQLMVIGKTLWGPKVSTLKEPEASLSCVQCFLYLISSSINVSIFHITWLDTFWIDLLVYWGYILLMDYSHKYYVVIFFISCYGLCFEVCYVWYKYYLLLSQLFFQVHLLGIFFSIPSLLACVYLLFWGGSLVDSMYVPQGNY